ncbi:uncharacterized protein [Montipora foliosa]|uniref:uncharacterized protein n=1 Tax=Montipora foliosa TaxID=591990 RepID=UPI0035F1CF74
MEKNAWRVAEEVARRIDDEPGPADDFMKSCTTSEKKRQFFFNRPYLMKYASTQSEMKRLDIPGCNYLKKIYTFIISLRYYGSSFFPVFIDDHFIFGEMFLEYLKAPVSILQGLYATIVA